MHDVYIYNIDAPSEPLPVLDAPRVVIAQSTNMCSSWLYEVTVGLPPSESGSDLRNETAEATQQLNPVTFILRVSSQDGRNQTYIWQVTFDLADCLSW